MKNITSVTSCARCLCCGLNGYITESPNGGDYITCPLCAYGQYGSSPEDDKRYKMDTIDYEDDDDLRNQAYCDTCRIIFDMGCDHAENGCSAGYSNGHMIGKWKYKTKDEIYIGMPQFDDIADWYNHANDIEILGWVCPNNGIHCPKAGYPESTHPQYYSKCELQK